MEDGTKKGDPPFSVFLRGRGGKENLLRRMESSKAFGGAPASAIIIFLVLFFFPSIGEVFTQKKNIR